MYDTAKRVNLVKKRGRQLRRREEKHYVYKFSALCVVLIVSLVAAIRATGRGQPALRGTYGSMLLRENVGGYVLVGVLTFAVAVVITVLCIRYKERMDQRDRGESEEEPVE